MKPTRIRRPSVANDDLPRSVLEHFAASGLNAEHLRAMRVEYVPHSDVPKCPVPSARIPYFDLSGNPTGFFRLRLLGEWTPEGESKPRRYAQPKDSGNHLYLPPLLARSWAEIAADVSVRVGLTEGEKKAASACANGIPVVGIGGVWNWKTDGHPIKDLDLFRWEAREVDLCFDRPDVFSNPKVREAIDALADELRTRGAVVRFVVLPLIDGLPKVGLDDFIVARGPEAFLDLRQRAAEHLDVARLNESLAVTLSAGKFLVLHEWLTHEGKPEFALAKPADIRTGFMSDRVLVPQGGDKPPKFMTAFDLWLNSPDQRRLDGVLFEPGGNYPNYFNIWRGFAVEPREGDCSLFLDHVRDVVCAGDKTLNDYVLTWLADAVQNTASLPGTALVLRGKQGTGKGTLAVYFGDLFGSHFAHLSHERHLIGNFNGHTKDKVILYADEAFLANHKAVLGSLKALITEPTRMIEFKGRDAFAVRNFARVIMASNHDYVVPAGPEERRFVVIDVSDKRMQDHAYFAALKQQMEHGGREALLHYLLRYDTSKVNLRALPQTEALWEQKVMALDGVQRFWYERLWHGENDPASRRWEELVPKGRLRSLLADHLSDTRDRTSKSDETAIGMALKKLVPGLRDTKRDGKWCYRFPPLVVCRQQFADAMRYPVPWPDVTEAKGGKAKGGTKW